MEEIQTAMREPGLETPEKVEDDGGGTHQRVPPSEPSDARTRR